MQISIGHIEIFRETISALLIAKEQLQSASQHKLQRLDGIVSEYNFDVQSYQSDLESTIQTEQMCQWQLDQAMVTFTQAKESFMEAESNLLKANERLENAQNHLSSLQ
ncbi:MAG: hypothetical protein LBC20_09615 [Planctomycetaceae bacterium]|jgi:hypothetical protein|nr:hypothetical protein [Planctomycetaceae bacterium]